MTDQTEDENDRAFEDIHSLDDEELGRAIRQTETYKLAVAARDVHEQLQRIQENGLMWSMLIDRGLGHTSRVSSAQTVERVIGGVFDALDDYSQMVDDPEALTQAVLNEEMADD